MANKSIVQTQGAPQAIGPYSQAVIQDGWVYCSGQIPLNPETMELESGDIQKETTRVLENLGAVLETAGCGWGDVVKTTVYMTDLGEFQAMNEIYSKFFGVNPPARACVQVAQLPKGCKVEIDAVAKLP